MSVQLVAIVNQVKQLLTVAPCAAYDATTRNQLFRTRTIDLNALFPSWASEALFVHAQACKGVSTPLPYTILVFCEDNLDNIHGTLSLDSKVSLRLKLGRFISTYESLMTWYLSYTT